MLVSTACRRLAIHTPRTKVPARPSARLSHLLARKRRQVPPGCCREKCMSSIYAACDERHIRNDFNLLRVTAPSHGTVSVGVGTSLLPHRATRMGVRRPAPDRGRETMMRTRDAIASLDKTCAVLWPRDREKNRKKDKNTEILISIHPRLGRFHARPCCEPSHLNSPFPSGFPTERSPGDSISAINRGPYALRSWFRNSSRTTPYIDDQ